MVATATASVTTTTSGHGHHHDLHDHDVPFSTTHILWCSSTSTCSRYLETNPLTVNLTPYRSTPHTDFTVRTVATRIPWNQYLNQYYCRGIRPSLYCSLRCNFRSAQTTSNFHTNSFSSHSHCRCNRHLCCTTERNTLQSDGLRHRQQVAIQLRTFDLINIDLNIFVKSFFNSFQFVHFDRSFPITIPGRAGMNRHSD